MEVETWPIERPKPYSGNPREIPGAAVDKVAASISEFGWRQPIVVDEGEIVIVGHTRLLAAQKLGLAEVPVHVAAGLTAAQVKAYRLADNRIGQETGWDPASLADELGGLDELDFDMSLTGFDLGELNAFTIARDPNGDDVDDHGSEWNGMPEFAHDDLAPYRTLKIHFKNKEDFDKFGALLDQGVTTATQFVWWPRAEPSSAINKRFTDEP